VAIRTYGPNAVDWEQRVDLDRLRTERLAFLEAHRTKTQDEIALFTQARSIVDAADVELALRAPLATRGWRTPPATAIRTGRRRATIG